ncbi:hypothetical protein DESUT3_15800 [Desulfuromonas versatilis]|uniref:DUF2336 domain-containing protein n=1 Tax=Desulfuromonas versatilis TaxID=2802975 RepID=A0ABN6E064_9BACT|nr:hypothetical protein [Desulfuromonas versatilis]BCR04511.1 hypothetical protein DESUT3_15800 [Desulfuromonas versatilis]
MEKQSTTLRLLVSPEVARVVGKSAPREVRMTAARGAVPLSGRDLVTALFFLCHGGDPEIRDQALATLRDMPATLLASVVREPDLHPKLLDLIARVRIRDRVVMETLLVNHSVETHTLSHVAGRCDGVLLSLLAANDQRLLESPELVAAIVGNPHADRALKFRLGWREEPAEPPPGEEPTTDGDPAGESAPDGMDEPGPEGEDDQEAEFTEEEVNLSKYQLALEMGVSEKIKMALTGDKEWRNIFIKDANKLVSSAVLKNPRITDGEVMTIAKNKSSSEELIRLITLNREWVKNYEIKKALVLHPRTPLPKALRFMNILGEKDLKTLAKSRNVSQVIANNARRMLMAKVKKN